MFHVFVTISSGVFLPKNRWTDSTDAFKVDAIIPVSMSCVLFDVVCACPVRCVSVYVKACLLKVVMKEEESEKCSSSSNTLHFESSTM